MEPSNQPAQQPADAPIDPTAPGVQTPMPPVNEGGNKMAMWLVIGVVIIVLVVGGIYWYLSSQNKVEPTPQATTQTTTQVPEEDLEQEADSIDVQAADFTEVDSDLKGL